MNIRLSLTRKPAHGISRALQMLIMALLSPFGLLGFFLLSLTSGQVETASAALSTKPAETETADTLPAKTTQGGNTSSPKAVSGLTVPGWDLL